MHLVRHLKASLTQHRPGRRGRAETHGLRLWLEPLETRTLPTVTFSPGPLATPVVSGEVIPGGLNSGTPVGGMFVLAPPTTADGNVLWYSRHEFNTYFLQHLAGQPRSPDPSDPNWHIDGTRHVDHNHIILAIAGKIGGAAPAAGATPAFNLMVKAQSLFFTGLTGTGGVTMSGAERRPSRWVRS